MTTLSLTTADPHDTLTRVLGIFRLMDLPLGHLAVEPGRAEYRIRIGVADDEQLVETLAVRFARVVSVASVAVSRDAAARAAAA